MGFIDKTPERTYRAYFRDPAGKQRSKTFRTKRDAVAFLAEIEMAKRSRAYVAPDAGRVLFGEYACRWAESWNTEATTVARDRSILRTHALPRWGAVPLDRINALSVQTWVAELGRRRSRATVAVALRLTTAVLRSAVRDRLVPFNAAEGVRVPKPRRLDTDERIISQADLRGRLLPQVPRAAPGDRGDRRRCRAPVG